MSIKLQYYRQCSFFLHSLAIDKTIDSFAITVPSYLSIVVNQAAALARTSPRRFGKKISDGKLQFSRHLLNPCDLPPLLTSPPIDYRLRCAADTHLCSRYTCLQLALWQASYFTSTFLFEILLLINDR